MLTPQAGLGCWHTKRKLQVTFGLNSSKQRTYFCLAVEDALPGLQFVDVSFNVCLVSFLVLSFSLTYGTCLTYAIKLFPLTKFGYFSAVLSCFYPLVALELHLAIVYHRFAKTTLKFC